MLYESTQGAQGVLAGWYYDWYWIFVAILGAILGSHVVDMPQTTSPGQHTVAVSRLCLVQTPNNVLT